jgi:1,4-alpha-glucan branching enzyme
VHCLQNHDQVGNRAMGDRLHHVVTLPAYRAASALLLLSPYTPLLWMGQEWAATTPFQYFTDHPEALGVLVTAGRRRSSGVLRVRRSPARERIPDPQAESTFLRVEAAVGGARREPHRGVLALYTARLALRRDEPALRRRGRDGFSPWRRWAATRWRCAARRRTAARARGREPRRRAAAGPRSTARGTCCSTPRRRSSAAAGGARATLQHDGASATLTRAGAGAVVLRAAR